MLRRCQVCGALLSSYNSEKLCFPCLKIRKEKLESEYAYSRRSTLGSKGVTITIRNVKSTASQPIRPKLNSASSRPPSSLISKKRSSS